jgi:hypothetical protein
MNIGFIDFLFLLTILLLYIFPKKSKKYKWFWVISLFIFLINFGIRFYLIDQKHKNTGKIIQLQNQLKQIAGFVDSSSIEVYLKISSNIKAQSHFNGTISTGSDFCTLLTKSREELTYKSLPGTTSLIRDDYEYIFSFKAYLPQEENIFRENPEEFLQAQKITVPLGHFVRFIKKKKSTANAITTLKEMKIQYYINNLLLAEEQAIFDIRLDEEKEIYMTLK